MGRYKVARLIYEDTDVDEAETISLAEAAEILGLTIWAVVDRINKGIWREDGLTVLIDTEARNPQHRRRLLRAEVEALAASRR